MIARDSRLHFIHILSLKRFLHYDINTPMHPENRSYSSECASVGLGRSSKSCSYNNTPGSINIDPGLHFQKLNRANVSIPHDPNTGAHYVCLFIEKQNAFFF